MKKLDNDPDVQQYVKDNIGGDHKGYQNLIKSKLSSEDQQYVKQLKFDDLPPNASEIINATAKSSTEAAAFMQQVDLLGFNPQITDLLKLSYSQNYKKSTAELVDAGNDLARMLNEKTYGPVKRLWARFANNFFLDG